MISKFVNSFALDNFKVRVSSTGPDAKQDKASAKRRMIISHFIWAGVQAQTKDNMNSESSRFFPRIEGEIMVAK